jgi:cation diffusion facilitator CzcD-associated flavoprotein CzcO
MSRYPENNHALLFFVSLLAKIFTELSSQAFPFDPNPSWSKFYVGGPEIHDYIKRTVKKWNLDRDVQLNTKVVGTYWQEQQGLWKVVVEHNGVQREEYAEILISGQGFLKYE